MAKEKRQWLWLLPLTAIFIGMFLIFGSKTYTDTTSYEVMSPVREPLYPMLLLMFRGLFGDMAYDCVALVQNILAIVACYMLLTYVAKYFQMQSFFLKLLLMIVIILPYVISPLFSVTRMVISNSILTEGITLSLYYLYMYFMLHLIWKPDCDMREYVGYSVVSMIISLALVLCRGQMLVTTIAWCIVQAIIIIRRDRKGARALLCLSLLVAMYLIRTVSVGAYNYVYSGVFAATPYGKVTLLTNVLYVADEDSGDGIEDETLRGLYDQMYTAAKEQNLLYTGTQGSFAAEINFFSDTNTTLKMDVIEATLTQYIEDTYGNVEYINRLILMDEMSGEILSGIIGDCLPEYIANYMRNIALGLIRSVAVLHPLLYIPIACGYILLIVLGIYIWRHDHENPAVKLLAFTALLTAGTVAAVSIMIMCISRYVMYNTAFIYMSGILMIRDIIMKKEMKENGIQRS